MEIKSQRSNRKHTHLKKLQLKRPLKKSGWKFKNPYNYTKMKKNTLEHEIK